MKLFRVYFNRLNEAPQIWSIDEGDQTTEINVTGLTMMGCDVESKCNLSETDTENRPKAWFEVRGFLRVEAGVAIISGRHGFGGAAPLARIPYFAGPDAAEQDYLAQLQRREKRQGE